MPMPVPLLNKERLGEVDAGSVFVISWSFATASNIYLIKVGGVPPKAVILS